MDVPHSPHGVLIFYNYHSKDKQSTAGPDLYFFIAPRGHYLPQTEKKNKAFCM